VGYGVGVWTVDSALWAERGRTEADPPCAWTTITSVSIELAPVLESRRPHPPTPSPRGGGGDCTNRLGTRPGVCGRPVGAYTHDGEKIEAVRSVSPSPSGGGGWGVGSKTNERGPTEADRSLAITRMTPRPHRTILRTATGLAHPPGDRDQLCTPAQLVFSQLRTPVQFIADREGGPTLTCGPLCT
jgi:hypothetical protein